jgi:hypothetical protein
MKEQNYKDYPDKYICAGNDFDPVGQKPDYIIALDLCNQIYLIGNDGMFYLDLRSSQESTGYSRWLDMLSEEDRKKELEDDFVGGGCH